MDDLGDLAELRVLAVLAAYRPDGTVFLSPVWHEWRDGGFHVVTSSRDVKAAHLRRDPGQASWSANTPRPTAESRPTAEPSSAPRESDASGAGHLTIIGSHASRAQVIHYCVAGTPGADDEGMLAGC